MEFKSTLKKERDDIIGRAKENVGTAQYHEHGKEIDIIANTPAFLWTRGRAKYIAKTIQPSILEDDLRIAITLQLAMACELLHNLVEDGLISINKKED